tara:strand:+ start:576 stop:860 length:285 start_codon:yes stop_codon:yes gene_type:complete
MLEKQVERYLVKKVEAIGGKAYKFTSPGRGGVADRIVCLPDGRTWFVELKTAGGKMSALQLIFAADMRRMKQNYTVLWSKEDVDEFTALSSRGG